VTGAASAGFAKAAARDGIVLQRQSYDWLSEQGHVGLERVARARRDPALVGPVKAALEVLGAICARLRGDVSVLHASRENLLLPVDLVHIPTGTVIEVDGPEHFTSFRSTALGLYPAGAAVGFDIAEHEELCRTHGAAFDGLAKAQFAVANRLLRPPELDRDGLGPNGAVQSLRVEGDRGGMVCPRFEAHSGSGAHSDRSARLTRSAPARLRRETMVAHARSCRIGGGRAGMFLGGGFAFV